jgi:hypothetical protein
VYFAAAYGGGLLGYHYGYAWTGVSEAPSLRPIAYWSKGDAWYGGGLFQDDRTLWINQPADERSLFAAKDDEAFRTTFDVTFNAEASGEDEPIFGMRRSRDGWQLLQEAVIEFTRPGFTTPVPEVREKKRERHTIRWTRSLEGYTKLNVFELVSEDATQTLPDAQWADWDHGGRLAFIREGRLYVVDADADVASPTEIADFNTFQPEDRVPDA